MKTSALIRFLILGAIWVALVALLLLRSPKITLYTIFVVVTSGIIVFVPLYKKFVNNGKR